MRKLTFNKPIPVNDAQLDELFEDTGDWQLKAERFMKRRERKLRNQMLQY